MRSEQCRDSLILTFLLCVAVNAFSEIGKCCPPGQIFSSLSPGNCTEKTERASELYTVNSTAGALLQEFPTCDEPDDLTTTLLADFGHKDFIRQPACLEILHNESARLSALTLIHCRSAKDRKETDAVLSAPLPKILNIRRCCPTGRRYDTLTKKCVPLPEMHGNGSASEEDALVSILQKSFGSADFLAISRGRPVCDGTVYDYEIDATHVTFDRGDLQITLPASKSRGKGERISVTDGNACLDVSGDTTSTGKLVARVCHGLEFCKENMCVHKCCSEDASLLIGYGCAKYADATSDIPFHQAVQNSSGLDSSHSEYGVVVGIHCEYGMYPLQPSDGPWSLTPEGHVFYDSRTYLHDQYCLEEVYNSTDYDDRTYSFICFDKPTYEEEPSRARYHFNTALQAISCTFLLITLLVYASLPVLQNLHGKTLMCHVASLILAYVCIITVPWVTPHSLYWNADEDDASIVCPLIGYGMLFSFLAAFSWLNIMCFDIWWTFGGLRGHSTRDRGHRKKFMIYSLYAWGLPILLTGLAVLADKTEILPLYIRPNINLMSCWFPKLAEFNGELPFFVGPILAQLIANVVFFTLTAIHCSQVKDELKRINASDVSDSRKKRFQADRTKLVTNVKLFIVMGVSWLAEIASFFVNKYASDFSLRDELFYLTDSFNCLQGLLIFILFVLKLRVYNALRKRLGFDKRKPTASQGTTALQDPYRIKQSTSTSSCILTSSSFHS